MELTKNILSDLLVDAGLPISEPPPASLEEVPPAYLAKIIGSVQRLYEWDSATNMAIAQGCNFQALLDITEPLLHNPVIIYDYMTYVSAHTSHVPCNDPIFQKAVELQKMPEELVQFMLDDVKHLVPQITTDGPVVVEHKISHHPEIICQIKVNGRFMAYLYMQCSNRPLSPGLLDFLGIFARKLQILADQSQGDLHGIKINDEQVEQLLAHITQGIVKDPEIISNILARHGLPLTGQFQLYLISDPNRDLEILHSSLRCLSLDAKLFRCDSCLLILATYSGMKRSPANVQRTLEAYLHDWLAYTDLQCGVSRVFTQMTQMPTAYTQALEAHEMALKLRSRDSDVASWARTFLPRNLLARFEDFQLHILLNRCGPDYAASFCDPSILSSLENDRNANTDVFKVFYVYMCLNRSTTKTAEVFHMHRNTIVYRINRNCEKYNFDLDDELTRQKIALSFAYLELFG